MTPEVVKNVTDSIEEANREDREHSCKRCGWDQTQDVVHVDEAILKQYFKCALSQSPFSHTYSLFNGMLNVTYEEPTGKLLKLQELATLHRTKQDESTLSDAMDFSMLPTLAMVSTNSEEEGVKIVYKASVERRAQLLEKFELPDELRNMPLIMLQSLRNTYGQFSQLMSQLVNEAYDANFWKGAGRN